jgi:hypothetical protein
VFGIVTLAWHDYNAWHRLKDIWNVPGGPVYVYLAGIAQILGGSAILFARTKGLGAVILAATYLAFGLLWVPRIVAVPQVYTYWGSFFEQFSLVVGAALVYAASSQQWSPKILSSWGRWLFGLCVVSFTLEQAFYLNDTASLVPKWIPPNQMFWAVLTTVAFGLAAIALLSNTLAPLATRLTTAMIVIFGVVLWIPALVAAPTSGLVWGANAENFAMAGAAWILADYLYVAARGA